MEQNVMPLSCCWLPPLSCCWQAAAPRSRAAAPAARWLGQNARAVQGPLHHLPGSDLKGRVGPQSDIHDAGSRLTAKQIKTQIEQGGSLMPAFKDRLSQRKYSPSRNG